MKKIFAILIGILATASLTGTAVAVNPASATSTAWGAGNTITSGWLNSVGTLITQLLNGQSSTSTPLGTIANQATTTGNILVASTTTGWVALAVGSNGQCPIASSTAPLGIAWGICGGSINGTLASSYFLTAAGTGFSVSTNGATTTFTLASSSYLQPVNNLSELTNTSTARTNLGALGTINNLSDLTSTSSARTNLGLGPLATVTTTPSDSQIVSASGTTPVWKTLVAGSNITIGTSSTSTTITASAAGVAGLPTQLQYNEGNSFAATSSLTYTSSTQQLTVSTPSSSILIGSSSVLTGNFYGQATSTVTVTLTSTSTLSWTVPINLFGTTISVTANGASGNGYINNGGIGAYASGTITTSGGTVYYYRAGWSSGGGTAGATGNCNAAGTGVGGAGATGLTVAQKGTSPGAPCTDGGNAPDIFSGAGSGGTHVDNGRTGGSPSWFATSSTFTTSTAILIGGAGGGGGVDSDSGGRGSGGAAGNATGTAGANAALTGASGGGGGGESLFASSGVTATSSATTGFSSGQNGTVVITYTIYTNALSSTSTYGLAVANHIITGGLSSSTVSSVSACGGGSPSIVGNDTVGIITVGNSTTSCQMTFASTWFFTPVCTANIATGTVVSLKVAPTTSTVLFTASSAMTTSSKINYMCLGY